MDNLTDKPPVNRITLNPEQEQAPAPAMPPDQAPAPAMPPDQAPAPGTRHKKRGRPKKKSRVRVVTGEVTPEPIPEEIPENIPDVDAPADFYGTALRAMDVYLFGKEPDFATKEEIFSLKIAVEDYVNNQASPKVKKYFGEYHSFIIIAGIIARRFDFVKKKDQSNE